MSIRTDTARSPWIAGEPLAALYARLALGSGFLSAVADRFGLWGAPEEPGVAWGSFAGFLDYTAVLNPYLPEKLIPALGWTVTAAEIALGIALVVGFRVRVTAAAAAILLFAFALGMTFGTGVKSVLDASVFAASAGACLLAFARPHPMSIDGMLMGRSTQAIEHREEA